MDLRDAALMTARAYPGGIRSLAPRMGKSDTTLAHELRGTGHAKLGLLDAEAMCLLSGDARILEAFALNVGYRIERLPEAAGGDVAGQDEAGNAAGAQSIAMARLGAVASEFSQLCAEATAAMSDGRISQNELFRIHREVGDLIASARALQQACGAMSGGKQ